MTVDSGSNRSKHLVPGHHCPAEVQRRGPDCCGLRIQHNPVSGTVCDSLLLQYNNFGTQHDAAHLQRWPVRCQGRVRPHTRSVAASPCRKPLTLLARIYICIYTNDSHFAASICHESASCKSAHHLPWFAKLAVPLRQYPYICLAVLYERPLTCMSKSAMQFLS